jgi:signal transduction histidine kinase
LVRELHDGVGGMLAAIKMNISAVQQEKNEPYRSKGIHEVMQLIEETANEVRRTAHNLMPEILNNHNLPEALRIYCDSFNNFNTPQIDLQFHFTWPESNLELELPLYRILQELIQNILKHAQAKHVVIQFRFQDDMLHVTIEDDGMGFETDKVNSGLGLDNVRSRVSTLHGHIFIESSPNRGTTCYIELPFVKENNYKKV